jgi:hypothetical protein
LAAFRSATASRAYGGRREDLLDAPSVKPARSETIVAPGGGFGEPSLATRAREELGERKAWLAVGAGALLVLLSLVVVLWMRRRRARSEVA